MRETNVAEIIDQLWTHPENAEWTPKVETIPLAQIKEWMKSSDIEVLGLVSSTIREGRFKVEPEMDLNDYVQFFKLYYGRCLRENPDGDWSDSRCSAGWDLVNLLSGMWRQDGVPRSVMEGWKKWLADLYVEGPKELRLCIVQATLEHLLEQKEFRKFFADWKTDPVLKVAYEEALLWHQGGGTTPLGKPPLI